MTCLTSSKLKRRPLLLCRKAPKFWWRAPPSTLWAYGLWPLSSLFRLLAWLRQTLTKSAAQAPYPVFSIGNLVVGGAGKTPLTLWLIDFLKAQGWEPRVVTRGYGSRLKGPLAVDPQQHTFEDVGDEALLLAKRAQVYLASPRNQVLPLLKDIPPNTVLLLDDAHQHASLKKDVSLVVVDGKQGFGNGFLLPAGPLRESVKEGLSKACAVVVMGTPSPGLLEILQHNAPKIPLLKAWMKPITDLPLDAKIFGFAGIGFPEKFMHTLDQLQGKLVCFEAFPDHHPYTVDDMKKLANKALKHDAILVTTAKDWVRIPKHFQEHIHVIDIEVVMEETSQKQLEILLQPHLIGKKRENL